MQVHSVIMHNTICIIRWECVPQSFLVSQSTFQRRWPWPHLQTFSEPLLCLTLVLVLVSSWMWAWWQITIIFCLLSNIQYIHKGHAVWESKHVIMSILISAIIQKETWHVVLEKQTCFSSRHITPLQYVRQASSHTNHFVLNQWTREFRKKKKLWCDYSVVPMKVDKQQQQVVQTSQWCKCT